MKLITSLAIFIIGFSTLNAQELGNLTNYFKENSGKSWYRSFLVPNREPDPGIVITKNPQSTFVSTGKLVTIKDDKVEAAGGKSSFMIHPEDVSGNDVYMLFRNYGEILRQNRVVLINDLLIAYRYNFIEKNYLITEVLSLNKKSLETLTKSKVKDLLNALPNSELAKVCGSTTVYFLTGNDMTKRCEKMIAEAAIEEAKSNILTFKSMPSSISILPLKDSTFTTNRTLTGTQSRNGKMVSKYRIYGCRIDFEVKVDGKTYSTLDEDFLPAYIPDFNIRITPKFGNRYKHGNGSIKGVKDKLYTDGDGHFYIYGASGRVPLEFYYKDSLIARKYIYLYHTPSKGLTADKHPEKIKITQVLSNNRNLHIFQTEIKEDGKLLINSFNRKDQKYFYYRLEQKDGKYTWDNSEQVNVPRSNNAWSSYYSGNNGPVLLPGDKDVFINKMNEDWPKTLASFTKSPSIYYINLFFIPKHKKYILIASDSKQSTSAGIGTNWQYRSWEVSVLDENFEELKYWSHGNDLEILSAEINTNNSKILFNCRFRNSFGGYVNRPHLVDVEKLLQLPEEFPYSGTDEISTPGFKYDYLKIHSWDLNKYITANSSRFFSSNKGEYFSVLKNDGSVEEHDIKEYLPEGLRSITAIAASDKHLVLLTESFNDYFVGYTMLVFDMNMNLVCSKNIHKDIFRGNDTWDMTWDITHSHLFEHNGDFYLMAAEAGKYKKNAVNLNDYISIGSASSLFKISIKN